MRVRSLLSGEMIEVAQSPKRKRGALTVDFDPTRTLRPQSAAADLFADFPGSPTKVSIARDDVGRASVITAQYASGDELAYGVERDGLGRVNGIVRRGVE